VFSGFDPGAPAFFAELARENSRVFFEAHRALHRDGIARPMQALMEEAQAAFGGEVKLFRPHRDVRFAKDRSPFNTHQRAALHGLGPLALYAALDAEGFHAGGGVYGFLPERLALYREVVAADAGAEFAARVAAAVAAGATLSGEALARVPKGYPPDHPRADLLKLRNLILLGRMDPGRVGDAEAVRAHAFAMWRAVMPVADWLLAAMGRRADRAAAVPDPPPVR
jgi:uncharacterized protein (TIGR02453 family)